MLKGRFERLDLRRYLCSTLQVQMLPPPPRGGPYIGRLMRASNRADLVLCGSEFVRNSAIELGFDQEKTKVHYLGVRVPDELILESRPPGHTIRLISVSRLHPVKGFDLTLRAVALVLAAGHDVTLRHFGDGPQRAVLQKLVQDLNIHDVVEFVGEAPRDKVFTAMSESDIFVQHNVRAPTGAEEAIGGSILEASAHGLPVVVAASGGVGEGVRHEQTGLVVESGDVSSMAESIARLCRNQNERHQFGSNGRRFVQEFHDSEKQNVRLLETIRGLGWPTQ